MILDKEHTKEYKRCRNELKKRSSDTLRLQKKAKKGTSDNLQNLVESSMQTVNQQKAELDEVERKSLRVAMIEDRTRFCHFVSMLEPVVKQEYEMMYELGHLQVNTYIIFSVYTLTILLALFTCFLSTTIDWTCSKNRDKFTCLFFLTTGSDANSYKCNQRSNCTTSGVGRAHSRVKDLI